MRFTKKQVRSAQADAVEEVELRLAKAAFWAGPFGFYCAIVGAALGYWAGKS